MSKREDATRYNSACMRLSYLAQDSLRLAKTAKHFAQTMGEPREIDFIPLKRAARYLVGNPKLHLSFRRLESGEKARRDWWLQIGNHTVKSGSTLQSLTALSAGEVEFCAGVKGGQIGLYLRSIYMDLGIPMKVEIQRDCSTANYLTDRLGRGPRTKHTDTRYLGARTRSRWRSQYQGGAYSENRTDVGTKPVCASVPQQHCKFAGLKFD